GARFFAQIYLTHNVVKVGLHTINSALGDAIVVWRCYVIWGRSWKVCVVPVLWRIGQSVAFANAKNASDVFDPNIERWNGALFTLTLTTNVLVTSLIVYKILRLRLLQQTLINPKPSSSSPNRVKSGSTSTFYTRVLITVIESGSVYSTALILEIAFYLANSNVFYIVYDPIAQLTALMPTSIIVLSTLHLTMDDFCPKSKNSQVGSSGRQFESERLPPSSSNRRSREVADSSELHTYTYTKKLGLGSSSFDSADLDTTQKFINVSLRMEEV
ncbi:hypothetical protein K435DRAFT_781228, partial [Dendrothele bispora CBS 962.96]